MSDAIDLTSLATRIKALEDELKGLRTKGDGVRGTSLAVAIAAHLAIPSLRGFWPMSAEPTASLIESLGPSRQLSIGAGRAFGMTAGLVPYTTLAAASAQYLYRADETGLRGSDMAGKNGMTWGGWFNPTSLPTNGNYMGLISKWASGTQAADEYITFLYNSGGTQQVIAAISNGVTTYLAIASQTLSLSTWYHIVGRWVASASVDLFINGVKTTYTSGIPATIVGNTATFDIGAFSNPLNYFNGSTTLDFLSGYPLSDAHIQSLYAQASGLFP